MDVMRPELVWVDGGCYRKMPIRWPGEDFAATRMPAYVEYDDDGGEPGCVNEQMNGLSIDDQANDDGPVLFESESCVRGPPCIGARPVAPPDVDEQVHTRATGPLLGPPPGFEAHQTAGAAPAEGSAYGPAAAAGSQSAETVASSAASLCSFHVAQLGTSFACRLPIAKAYYGCVIGKNGDTRRRTEAETQCRINVPRFGVAGDVGIEGPTREAVETCANRLLLVVDAARQREPFTHFLSVALKSSSLHQGFKAFKDGVRFLADNDRRGIDDSLFQSYDRLHLTFGMLVLKSDVERVYAEAQLRASIERAMRTFMQKLRGPLRIELHGVEYMNDDPSAVDVLFAKVRREGGEEPKLLERLANHIVDDMANTGLMPRRADKVKLHATVMNSVFRARKAPVEEHQASGRDDVTTEDYSAARPRETFDARALLKSLAHFHFGQVELTHVHLSERFSSSKASTDREYYRSTATVPIVVERDSKA